jgi:hypothetical protein
VPEPPLEVKVVVGHLPFPHPIRNSPATMAQTANTTRVKEVIRNLPEERLAQC